MKLRRFRLHNIRPFGDVELDLDAIPGTVIAVVGSNWAGKTTLLEGGYCGPLFRETPTRGRLSDLATARDSFVESHVGDLVIRQYVDAKTSSGKALVKHVDGRVLVESGGVADFDRWAATNLPPSDLFFAAIFGAQGASGFLGMGAADRKKVLLRALGIERIEAAAERARDEARRAKEGADGKAARIAEERRRATPIEAAQRAVEEAAGALVEANTRAAAARDADDAATKATTAREIALAARRAHDARAEDLRGTADRLAAEGASIASRSVSLAAAVQVAPGLRALAAEVVDRRARADALRAAVEDAEEHGRREREALHEEENAAEQVRDLERRLAAARTAVADHEAVRAQAGRVEELRGRVADSERAERAAAEAAAQAEREARAEEEAAERARATALEHGARRDAAKKRILALRDAEGAERRLPDLRAAAKQADTEATEIDARVERLRTLLVGGKDDRIKGLRGGLELVRDEGAAPDANAVLLSLSAKETLVEDGTLADEHAAAPEALRVAEEELRQAQARVRDAHRALRDAEAIASRRSELEAAKADYNAAERAASDAWGAMWRHKDRHADACAEQMRKADEARDIGELVAERREPLAEAERAAARLPEIAAAEATIAGLEEQVTDARAAYEAAVAKLRALGEPPARPASDEVAAAMAALVEALDAQKRLPELAEAEATLRALDEQATRVRQEQEATQAARAVLGEPPTVPPAPEVAAAERAVREAERAVREAVAAHARAEQALAAAQATAARLDELGVELGAAEQLVADWALIARGLGRDGIQALLIDAAGPELTALVNDLLRECFGYRFTVSIATTRPKADGKGDREVCDVMVIEDGDEKEARFLSGGAKAIVGEAIAIAIAILSCRRAGLRESVLVRDETAGALSEENARAYVRMLRQAAKIAGASKVLFVSHTPSTWALADAMVHVAGAKITVEPVDSMASVDGGIIVSGRAASVPAGRG